MLVKYISDVSFTQELYITKLGTILHPVQTREERLVVSNLTLIAKNAQMFHCRRESNRKRHTRPVGENKIESKKVGT